MAPWSCRLSHVVNGDGFVRFSKDEGPVSQQCSVALYLKVISLPMIISRKFSYNKGTLYHYYKMQVLCTFDNEMCALNYIDTEGNKVYLGYLEENSPWYVVEAIADKLNTAYILDGMGAE